MPSTPYLGHVNDAHREGLVAQDGAVLVPLPALQHDLQLVAVPLQKVWVLGGREGSVRAGLGMAHGEVGSSSSVLAYSRGCPAHL